MTLTTIKPLLTNLRTNNKLKKKRNQYCKKSQKDMKSRHKQLQNIKIGKKKCWLIIKRKGKQKKQQQKNEHQQKQS